MTLATPVDTLTPRQLELLRALAVGRTLVQYAAESYLSYNTVKTTMRLMQTRLGAQTAAHAVARGFQLGLLDDLR